METIVAVAEHTSAVVSALRSAGWRVRLVAHGFAIDEVGALSPDAVLVDLQPYERLTRALEELAVGVGLDATPIVAVVDVADAKRIAAMVRVDDFVVRPVRQEELSARLRRLLKPRTAAGDDDGLWTIGPISIDLKRFEATLGAEPMELAYQEFQLLRFLVANPDQAFTRDQLLTRVWGWDYYGGPRTVDIHVRRVRAKLGDPCADWLETVRNVGYRWSPRPEPVREVKTIPRPLHLAEIRLAEGERDV